MPVQVELVDDMGACRVEGLPEGMQLEASAAQSYSPVLLGQEDTWAAAALANGCAPGLSPGGPTGSLILCPGLWVLGSVEGGGRG